MTIIDLLRHGEPVGGRRYRGQLDDPLSERGWREMWHATSAETPWEIIICSPLTRCRAFAEQLSRKLSLPVTIDERLKEVGFGAWEGQSAATLRALDDEILKRFYNDPINHRPQGAESLEHFAQRVNQALQTAIETHQGKHILMVTHAGVIRCALTSTLGAPLSSMYRLSIATASLSRIQIEEQRPPTISFIGKTRLTA